MQPDAATTHANTAAHPAHHDAAAHQAGTHPAEGSPTPTTGQPPHAPKVPTPTPPTAHEHPAAAHPHPTHDHGVHPARPPVHAPETQATERPPHPPKPEGHAAAHPPHAGEHGHAAAPHPAPHHPTPTHHTRPDAELVVLPATMLQAEQNAAAMFAGSFTPALLEGLILKLEATADKHGGTSVKFHFEGPMVATNADLMKQELNKAVTSLPMFQGLVHGEHKPHAQSVEGNASAIELHIPKLSLEQYAGLIQCLAGKAQAAKAPHAPAPKPENVVDSIIHQGIANDNRALGITA